MVNLEEQIKLLVEAQALDSQILKLERELTEIPQRIKNIDDAFKAKMANLKSLDDKVKALQLKRKEREGDL